ncbi:heterokaryon incompatibility protein-domain-containing protein [Nemania sp. FL0031]|nr:heterokaryon incompatibility protein-domain-containing protein [Nemania sp. FL0031]
MGGAHDDSIPEAIFCEVCKTIFAGNPYMRWYKFWEKSSSKYDLPFHSHHPSLQSLKDAQKQRCSICSEIKLAIFDRGSNFPLKYCLRGVSFDQTAFKHSFQHDCSGSTHLWAKRVDLVIKESSRDFPFIFEIEISPPPSLYEELVKKSQRQTWTGHKDVLMLASAWLDECKNNHDNCSKSYQGKWKPTRLLDVSEEGRIKLVRGEGVAAGQTYATLSHCWGPPGFLVLTADTEQDFEKGKEISEFPLTFRETIETVRRLGLTYLWIDCYCIIQGDDSRAKHDWEHESKEMGKVYTNSLLNIGALVSNGPEKGLYRNRAPKLRSRFLWSPIQHIPSESFYLTPQKAIFRLEYDFFRMRKCKLMTRGWVTQECVLAPRMLSFGAETIYWQCSKQADSDGLHAALHKQPFNTAYDWKHQPFWMLDSLNRSKPDTLLDINIRWMGTLETYCQSTLTYPEEDIFGALDGIGAKMADYTRTPFQRGMLGSTFPEALLYRDYKLGPVPNPSVTNKPTWHWSSRYPRADYSLVLRLYNRERDKHGPCSPMAYAFMSDDCKPLPTEYAKGYWPNIFLIGRLVTKLPSFMKTSYDENAAGYKRGELYYIPLVYSHWSNHHNVPLASHKFSGIILLQSKSGAYRRVGIWKSLDCMEVTDDTTEEDQIAQFLAQIATVRPQMIMLE